MPLPLRVSALESWFTRHPGPYAHFLAGTQPESSSLADWLDDDALARLARLPLGYGDPPGDAALREAVGAAHGVGPERVVLTAGAAEANALALLACLGPDDVAVVQAPAYPQLADVAAMTGARIERWAFEASDAQERLEALLAPAPALLVTNFPHNPTGEPGDLVALAAALRGKTCWLNDEVYRDVGAPARQPSAAALAPERAIVTGSFSKAWGLPGLRLGWLVAPEAVIERALTLREQSTLALPAASEAAALALWPHRERIFAACRERLARNRQLVSAWAEARAGSLTLRLPEGSACALLRPRAPFDDEAFVEAFYASARGLVVPGARLGYAGALRVGYGHRDPEVLAAALGALGGALDAFGAG